MKRKLFVGFFILLLVFFGEGSIHSSSAQTCQKIVLSPGWNLIGLRVQPLDLKVEEITKAIESNLNLVKGQDGKFYIPSEFNLMDDWDVFQGYMLHMDAEDTLEVCGDSIPYDSPIVLEVPGNWHWVSYLPDTAVDAQTVLVTIETCLDLCQDIYGGFYIPGVVNTLGDLLPNQGYKMHMICTDTLIYNVISTSVPEIPYTQDLETYHFGYVANTGNSYSILINSVELGGKRPKSGDEIGVFAPSGLCVGGIRWQSPPLGLAAWEDDPQTEVVDGFRAGERMSFVFWDKSQDEQIELTAEYRRGNGRFRDDAYTWVDLKATVGLSQKPKDFELFQNFPNPFNMTTMIRYALHRDCVVELSIYDLLGRRIKTLFSGYQAAGYKQLDWNGEDDLGEEVTSGIYFYRIKAEDFSECKKLILLK